MKWTEWGFSVASVVAVACSGSSGDGGAASSSGSESSAGRNDGGETPREGGATPAETGALSPFDASKGSDANPTKDGGPACVPQPGTAALNAFCGSLQLAVMQHDSSATGLLLTGSLNVGSTGGGSCVIVDGVDIMSGTTLVEHLTGSGVSSAEAAAGVLAIGANPPNDITNRCSSNEAADRIDTYGVIVTGRADGGSFTASCAQAALGESWPPGLTVTCHRNLDEPSWGEDISVQASSFMGMTFDQTMANVIFPYDAGGTITTVDDAMFVMPALAPWSTALPVAPFNTTGWMGTANATLTLPYSSTEVELLATTNPFPSAVCPPASMGLPEAGATPPPILIGRITGTGGHGAFSTEAVFGGCVVEDLSSP